MKKEVGEAMLDRVRPFFLSSSQLRDGKDQ